MFGKMLGGFCFVVAVFFIVLLVKQTTTLNKPAMMLTSLSSKIENKDTKNTKNNTDMVYYKNKLVNTLSNKKVVKVFVDKSERKMFLLDDADDVVNYYHISLGDSPKGHKQQEGDEKTPEGNYTLDYKNENSVAYRSIHISYPNKKDKMEAEKMGVSPGGAIMIHGQMNGFEHLTKINQQRDWTDGCIAVTNEEMDEIMDLVDIGTKIQIKW